MKRKPRLTKTEKRKRLKLSKKLEQFLNGYWELEFAAMGVRAVVKPRHQ